MIRRSNQILRINCILHHHNMQRMLFPHRSVSCPYAKLRAHLEDLSLTKVDLDLDSSPPIQSGVGRVKAERLTSATTTQKPICTEASHDDQADTETEENHAEAVEHP